MKAWSRTQTLIALSSGESELAVVTKAAAEGLGLRSVLRDFGYSVSIEIHWGCDRRPGDLQEARVRASQALATADFWLQQRVKAKELRLYKFPGRDNPSDLLTKYKSQPEISRFRDMLRIRPRSGRPALAPSSCAHRHLSQLACEIFLKKIGFCGLAFLTARSVECA